MQRTFAAFIFGIALSACSPLKQSREFPKKEETAPRSPATLAEPNNRIKTWLEQIKTPAREKSHPARNCKNSCAGSFLENLRKNNLEAFKEENKFHLEAIQRASGEFTDDRSPDFFCIHEIPEKTDDEFFSAFRHKTLPIIFISFNKSIHQDLMMDRMVTFAAYHQRKLKNIETHRYENDDGCDIEGRDE